MKQISFARALFTQKLIMIRYHKLHYLDLHRFNFEYKNDGYYETKYFNDVLSTKSLKYKEILIELFSDDTKILLNSTSEDVGEICKHIIINDVKYFSIINDPLRLVN